MNETHSWIISLYLFQDPFVEELLQFLVAIVDTELFKTVHVEKLCQNENDSLETRFREDKTVWKQGLVKFCESAKAPI